jgi:hypothetical protein
VSGLHASYSPNTAESYKLKHLVTEFDKIVLGSKPCQFQVKAHFGDIIHFYHHKMIIPLYRTGMSYCMNGFYQKKKYLHCIG